MNEKFLEVLKHEGPVTIITVNAHPAHVVNTWMSYIDVVGNTLTIPAAGMHSIEADFPTDNHVTLTFGSKAVEGTVGPGAGFHVHGTGRFVDSGVEFEAKKARFPWVTRLLIVNIDDIQQKI
ncbi:pyridoxamine 5'-phosphate oxidase family protein [Lacticaseibacillus nasuensis]|uniref:Flavin mononucleotide-binding protein n=1 Tax=Lacticaseibacillus nasuensis JCM 17158 TaxID=1291734 RepID=A0A0R1JW42_9LACO|nr:pyridoxamine 5'-phosphate oxidase family protein [Lacticaseibacillus nasuensis]KRK72921.1 flavin mononucleotide-binding protein [Lacticaseibacillus nasuensis JCM 17158]